MYSMYLSYAQDMSYTEDSIKLPNLKHFTIQYNKQYMTKPILILF